VATRARIANRRDAHAGQRRLTTAARIANPPYIVLLLLLAAPVFAAGDLASLVRAYRQAPTAAKKAAVQAYAAAHPKQSAAAQLALGIAAFEHKDYPAAIAALERASVPQLADYAVYYLAAARVESKATGGVSEQLAPVHATEIRSPLAGRAWLLEGRAHGAAGVAILREHYGDLPQPDGDLTLGEAYQAAGDLANAAEFFQRVFHRYVSGEPAERSASALVALNELMGANYPAPLPQQELQRAGRLVDAGRYAAARAAYESLIDRLVGVDRDLARVRIGAADLAAGKPGIAAPYLRNLEIAESEADAERLCHLAEAARRMNDEGAMMSAVDALARRYPSSPWRLKAIVGAANRFLVANRVDEYLPLYKAAYENFPNDGQAGLYHWKVTFQAHLRDRADADGLLREHLRNYPTHSTTGAALYFLGRGHERRGELAAARAVYERLARAFPNQFYAIQARDRLSAPEVAGAAPADDAAARFLGGLKLPDPKPVPAEPARPTAARIERSRLLREAGLSDLADSELRFGARTDGQPQLLGMELAGAAETPHVALRVMKTFGGDYLTMPIEHAPRRYWEMLFPLPYRGDVESNARTRGLDPLLVAGLIRQESEFNPQAKSRANAYGLMQVRPATGREAARRAGVPRVTTRLLTQPAVNLKLGSAILRGMLDSHGGRIEETLAAYNAGPSRAADWRTWASFREPAEFIETIPFTETRDYVQAVLRNAEMYRRLYR
jgi:soluble lytic murein transglycosylase